MKRLLILANLSLLVTGAARADNPVCTIADENGTHAVSGINEGYDGYIVKFEAPNYSVRVEYWFNAEGIDLYITDHETGNVVQSSLEMGARSLSGAALSLSGVSGAPFVQVSCGSIWQVPGAGS